MNFFSKRFRWLSFLTLLVLTAAFLFYIFRGDLWVFYEKITNKEDIAHFVNSYGKAAPLVFIGLQILQVILAPFPGELTGFIGGYLFGAFKGFLFSSIGLTIGSLINFALGRFLGKRFIRRWIPKKYFNKFNSLLKRQGVIIIFIFFIFPGFPKDYFSFFLGISALPYKIFIFIASVGRMPGTFILSLQGVYFIDKAYLELSIIFLLCIIVSIAAYKFKDNIYNLLEKIEK
jgi:uncharacterized membrane protein YdjX (TVP38/TMEM64 family)